MTSRIFLIGPHGCGKSAIGRQLASRWGFQHWSVGGLARLAKRGRLPSDVPSRLMLLLARHVPGEPLADESVAELLSGVMRCDHIVVDGFPATPDQVAIVRALPDCRIVYVLTPKRRREEFLQLRSETSRRQWVRSTYSLRDASLPLVWRASREVSGLIVLKNSGPLDLTCENLVGATS